MIAALHSSRMGGTKDFVKNKTSFGWSTVESVYKADLYRAKIGISRRVPGLTYSHVVRDSWTRLNVLPAKIMQVLFSWEFTISMILIAHTPTYSNRT